MCDIINMSIKLVSAMSTVSKALTLLNLFTQGSTDAALGELAAQAGIDKATTRRMLVTLCEFGFVEQDPASRKYRIGPAVLPLARARERVRPLLSIVEAELHAIRDDLDETTHFSVAGRHALTVVRVIESRKSMRVHIDEGDKLPLCNTAAGIAYLASVNEGDLLKFLGNDLGASTAHSFTDPQAVRAAIAQARTEGIAATSQTFEEQVCGIGVAVRDGAGKVLGAIGVATPLHRMTEETRQATRTRLRAAAEHLAAQL